MWCGWLALFKLGAVVGRGKRRWEFEYDFCVRCGQQADGLGMEHGMVGGCCTRVLDPKEPYRTPYRAPTGQEACFHCQNQATCGCY